MRAEEAPAVTEQLQRLVSQVEKALPGFFTLTNQLARTLDNTVGLTSNLNAVALDARPAISNLTALSAQLRGQGALGAWLLSAEGQANVEQSLAGTREAVTNANRVLTNADATLTALSENLARSLDNLAGITSNLNNQVQVNTNMLTAISDAVMHADELLQGLKRHWLLRSAFKAKETNAPPVSPVAPVRSPKDAERR
jgi:ABC-type transporter Mla subunit MlaD